MELVGGGDGAKNPTNGSPGTANTGGGGGGSGGSGTYGGSGIVILRYPSTKTITVGAGLTSTTYTESPNKVTVFTAGTGNVSWA